MKANKFILISCILFLFVSGTAWAGNQVDLSKNSPALLASLDKAGVVLLDDTATAAIRGQADPVLPMYVLVKILGLNTLDYGSGVNWTLNPLGYRYGYYGGYNWSNTGQKPVDCMDWLFKKHDNASLTDSQLLDKLLKLATFHPQYSYWGNTYVSKPEGAPSSVKVFGVSLIGQKFFFGWRSMPYSEYSRREAVYGMQALILGKSLFPSLGSL